MLAVQDVRDDVANRVETYVTTNLGGFWDLVERSPAVHRRVNGVLINRAILKIPTRPNPLSTMAEYTSWASLTDRTYDGRHLPPGDQDGLPPAEDVAAPVRPRRRDDAVREVDRAVPLLRRVVRRRLPAQRAPAPGPGDRRAGARPRAQRVEPRDRPDPALRARRRRHARSSARSRAAGCSRSSSPARSTRRTSTRAAIKQFDRVTVVRAEQITDDAAAAALRVRQRHGQPAARLRDDGRAVPARAQPHRRAARARVPAGTTSACSRPRGTSSR